MRIAALACLLTAPIAWGHPMGNLSVNHYARLESGPKGVDVTYVLDMAEIPTFELTQIWGVAKDASKPVLDAKANQQAREWIHNLVFAENGRPLKPSVISVSLSILDGAGNLPVFRIASELHLDAKGGRLEYEDGNYPTRAGWREIVIRQGDGSEINRASNGDTEMSQALTAYPQDPTRAPPQSTKAWMEWKPIAPAPVTTLSAVKKPIVIAPPPSPPPVIASRDVRPPEAAAAGTVKRNDAISTILRMKEISWPLMATLIGLAFWFGALHALEPGHGKTMVAAYLVGEKGTPKHAIFLGAMVTFTHTVSVFVLGIATMFLSRYIMPDRISKFLGIVSGLSIVWIGAVLLWKRGTKLYLGPHGHRHRHGDHGPHHHGPGQSHSHTHVPEGDLSLRSLMALGASGGLVPCPSALILLLSAISIGRIGLGLVLLIAFSVGLAIVLSATGLAVLYAKNLFPERRIAGRGFLRYVPVFSAAAIVMIGAIMTGVSLGWIPATRFFG